MSATHSSTSPPISSQLSDDEIDLREIAASLGRQKNLIGAFAIAAALLSSFYAFTRKPVWEGSFQIVLENERSGSGGRLAQLAAVNPMLSNLAGLGGGVGNSSLETEVKILESPSVLKPIYDFVKTRKAASGEDVSQWIYTDWAKGNLSIKLLEGTAVLNLTYQDSDKSLVFPVLEKISKAYQEYSNLDNATSINNALKFAAEQSEILKAKAKDSNRRFDSFKFTYGISDNESSINIPQIDQLSSPLPQTSQAIDPLGELAAIKKELTRRRQFLTDADPSVQRLQKERKAILDYINQTGGGLISIAGGSKALNREILFEYKELQRTAMRDNAALTAMESELLTLQIQKAQVRPPWQLISTPTVLDKPVAPHKKRIVALGLLAGLIFGSGAALVRDRRSDLVFSEEELNSLIPCPLIKRLPSKGRNEWTDAADLLAAGPLAKIPGNMAVALIPIGNIPNAQLQAFSKELSRALAGRELLVSTDLLQTSRCATQLLLTSQGAATRTQLSQLRQKLALQGSPLAGWLLLDPNLNLI